MAYPLCLSVTSHMSYTLLMKHGLCVLGEWAGIFGRANYRPVPSGTVRSRLDTVQSRPDTVQSLQLQHGYNIQHTDWYLTLQTVSGFSPDSVHADSTGWCVDHPDSSGRLWTVGLCGRLWAVSRRYPDGIQTASRRHPDGIRTVSGRLRTAISTTRDIRWVVKWRLSLSDKIPKPCAEDWFHCQTSGECVPDNWLCDGEADCKDGSDELNCTAQCTDEEFMCDSKCISRYMKCDGHKDCDDDTDEVDCSE